MACSALHVARKAAVLQPFATRNSSPSGVGAILGGIGPFDEV
jgi:hypothetical protein